MLLHELDEIIQRIKAENPDDMNCIVVLPFKADIPGVFGFEGACPAVTEMITIGEAPQWIDDQRGENKLEEMRAFLIAPHSFHQDNEHGNDIEVKKTLN